MHECDYCDRSFEDEEAYLSHLEAEHEGELGRIDRRRVDGRRDDDTGTGVVLYGAAIVGALAILGLAYFLFFTGGADDGADGVPEPGQYGTAHDHGTMEVVIDGEELDFTDPQYAQQDDRFHFHGDDQIWHTHATGITVAYAMDTLGIEVREDRVTFEGTTYRDDEPDTTVVVEVNGEPVDPTSYVIEGVTDPADVEQGDHIRIVVETENSEGSEDSE